jgi:hypothetical protein
VLAVPPPLASRIRLNLVALGLALATLALAF